MSYISFETVILQSLNWILYTKTEKVHLQQFEQEWMYNNDIIET